DPETESDRTPRGSLLAFMNASREPSNQSFEVDREATVCFASRRFFMRGLTASHLLLKSNRSLPKLRGSCRGLRLCSNCFDESRLWNEIALSSRDTSSYVTE